MCMNPFGGSGWPYRFEQGRKTQRSPSRAISSRWRCWCQDSVLGSANPSRTSSSWVIPIRLSCWRFRGIFSRCTTGGTFGVVSGSSSMWRTRRLRRSSTSTWRSASGRRAGRDIWRACWTWTDRSPASPQRSNRTTSDSSRTSSTQCSATSGGPRWTTSPGRRSDPAFPRGQKPNSKQFYWEPFKSFRPAVSSL